MDRAVRRLKVSRSALIRNALREHLRRLSILEKERSDREGHARHPIARDEFGVWDRLRRARTISLHTVSMEQRALRPTD